MHTVIILNKHSSDLLKDFKFLFKPFIDEGTISFCDWNEFGTDVKTSVPDLYKIIKGKMEWRAVVVGTDSTRRKQSGPEPDVKNPFDFSKEIPEGEIPKESEIPMIRLAHMLCGYPVSTVKNFEKAFEYFDLETNSLKRVREKELTSEEIQLLGLTYGDQLKSIYMEELIPEDVKMEQKRLVEKYTFTDIRPREIIYISTRAHVDDEDHIYASWKTQLEMESSNFCTKNKYPSNCRFLCYSLTNSENSRYMRELVEFWVSVLTVSINKIPASTLQAYRLYKVSVDISDEEMSQLLNKHLNRMETVYSFIQERLRTRTDYSFEEEEELVEKQHIPVVFESTSTRNLYIDTNQVGLSRDCPTEEVALWNAEVREKQRNIAQYLKAPRRVLDKSSQFLKHKAEGFYGDEYELDEFQMDDLQEEIDRLEQEILACETGDSVDYKKVKADLQEIDKYVKKNIAIRMRKGIVVGMGAFALGVYLMGYLPFLAESMILGGGHFLKAFVLVLAALLIVAAGGVVALILLRMDIISKMEKFNDRVHKMVTDIHSSAARFQDYFSLVCTYMKAQSVFAGTKLKKESLSSERFLLRAHKQALKVSIDRDEEIMASYGLKRIPEMEKNVTSFFHVEKLPKDNSLYYYNVDKINMEIPVNTAGDLVKSPYKFVSRLRIDREDIYDKQEGEY